MIRKIIGFLALFFGSICFGLLFVFIFVNATELDCALQADNSYSCEIRTLLLGRFQTSQKQIEQIVDIQVMDNGCFDGCSYRAEFITTDGNRIPLTEVYTDEGPVMRQVDAIRSQIVVRADPLTYRAEPPWWVLFLVGGLTFMSMMLSPLVLLQKR